jgi:hypothetical protein
LRIILRGCGAAITDEKLLQLQSAGLVRTDSGSATSRYLIAGGSAIKVKFCYLCHAEILLARLNAFRFKKEKSAWNEQLLAASKSCRIGQYLTPDSGPVLRMRSHFDVSNSNTPKHFDPSNPVTTTYRFGL